LAATAGWHYVGMAVDVARNLQADIVSTRLPPSDTPVPPGATATASPLVSPDPSPALTAIDTPPLLPVPVPLPLPPRTRARLRRWAPDERGLERLVSFKDKLSFVLGVGVLILVAWSLGAGPQWFTAVYTLGIIPAVAYRLYRYWRVRQHYYLLDFCYWANALLLWYLWLDRGNWPLFQALWLFAMGPLAWSVPTFRNAVVFHSSDKLTSVALHLLPSWMCWCIRWQAPAALGYRYCAYVPDTEGGHCHTDLIDMYMVRRPFPNAARRHARHTHIYACTHAHTHTHAHVCDHRHTHTLTHTHVHAYRCTHAHTHTHTHTHTHRSALHRPSLLPTVDVRG
jgi:hypothetical protein